ncbi:DUF397 domain-containing protein [Streptomyces xiamenensis]|uniref:DUF397 domain-containing protein n=1 Tax=Streptomyces xiamenensis TaxID=408015 RepID=UPI0036E75720
MTAESPHWFTSSYSSNGGDCVEVAANLAASHGVVPVRDSKDADSLPHPCLVDVRQLPQALGRKGTP